jgi:MEMO1 family protein
LNDSLEKDERLVKALTDGDVNAYFRHVADERDARRICGLPPTYLTLSVLGPTRGSPLHYQQFVHPEGFESVSFTAMAFESV